MVRLRRIKPPHCTQDLAQHHEHRAGSWPLNPPPPGRAVLTCRCGVMLDLDDMHRPDRRPDRTRSAMRIDLILCARCARVGHHWPVSRTMLDPAQKHLQPAHLCLHLPAWSRASGCCGLACPGTVPHETVSMMPTDESPGFAENFWRSPSVTVSLEATITRCRVSSTRGSQSSQGG